MCGIWFSVGFTPDPDELDIVAHRGPDGRGWRLSETRNGPVALGHRRLAIIDTSDAARQPMAYARDRYWLVFNGEIYNHIELREELRSLGHVFATRSDSEVILAAYEEWGEACIERFIGMFAFVIYDSDEYRFYAVRDRFGIKPLYYVQTLQGIAFASEIKQLLRLPGISTRMNLARTYDFLSSGITDHTEETMFDGVRQLRGGECVSVDLTRHRFGAVLPIRRWYRLPPPGTIQLSEREAGDRFRELLSESVRLHLRSDVAIGSCLSGGLDSSAIVSLIDRQFAREGGNNRLNTISACYDDATVDERPFIEAVVKATKTNPHYVFPRDEDVMASAERITWHQDEPYGSSSIFAQWCVFEQAGREGIKVMLDGQGADEQLSGYHGGFHYYLASLLRRGRYIALLKTMFERHRFHGLSLALQLRPLIPPILPARFRSLLLRQRPALAYHDWLESDAFCGAGFPPSTFEAVLEREGLGPIRDIGDLCVSLILANLPMLLRYEDRNSMAHGVEARVPFLDHRLVEFSIGLGERHKMVGGDTKRVLRVAMAGIMPDKICQRRDKIGFATPEQAWFRGPLRAGIEAGVEETLRRYPGLLNPSSTRGLVADMLDGRRPVDFTLWRIVNVGMWGRVFAVTM